MPKRPVSLRGPVVPPSRIHLVRYLRSEGLIGRGEICRTFRSIWAFDFLYSFEQSNWWTLECKICWLHLPFWWLKPSSWLDPSFLNSYFWCINTNKHRHSCGWKPSHEFRGTGSLAAAKCDHLSSQRSPEFFLQVYSTRPLKQWDFLTFSASHLGWNLMVLM